MLSAYFIVKPKMHIKTSTHSTHSQTSTHSQNKWPKLKGIIHCFNISYTLLTLWRQQRVDAMASKCSAIYRQIILYMSVVRPSQQTFLNIIGMKNCSIVLCIYVTWIILAHFVVRAYSYERIYALKTNTRMLWEFPVNARGVKTLPLNFFQKHLLHI